MNVRFNSEKTLVKASELYNNMSISKAQFYRFINKWIINGVSLAEMGKVKVGKLVLWDGQKFLDCLIQYENETTPKYDYEHQDQNLAIAIVRRQNDK